MTDVINKWTGKGKEDEDDRSYWFDVLHNLMGVEEDPYAYIWEND